jgi:hypothetical protein
MQENAGKSALTNPNALIGIGGVKNASCEVVRVVPNEITVTLEVPSIAT